MKRKVALGLSGGVDSSVAALLLTQQGYDVHCIYLNCFDEDIPGCRTKEDRKDALAVALHLNLPFQVLDFRREYQASVIDYFKSEYEAGRTPNPDVVCNRDIKFGLFYKWALRLAPLAQGKRFDYVATGHYADVPRFFQMKKSAGTPASRKLDTSEREAGSLRLKREFYRGAVSILRIPRDLHKDQTYFLWQVPRERFSRVLFPLGDYLKREVREIARKEKLPVAEKKDSTGICFIGEVSVEEFLKRLGVKEQPGDVVDTSGRIIGRHRGVVFYTIGQRHGFEINSKLKTPFGLAQGGQNSKLTDKPPLYVIEKDVEHNRLIVGFGTETYRSQFAVSQTNWLTTDYRLPTTENLAVDRSLLTVDSSVVRSPSAVSCFVRIRHGGELIRCQLTDYSLPTTAGNEAVVRRPLAVSVRLFEAQRGLAPGQSAVFYTGDGVVLGGGVIQRDAVSKVVNEQGEGVLG